MNTIFKILGMGLVVILLLFVSCRKYQVNSDTKEVNEVTIGGLQASYTAFVGANYQINPVLTFTQDKNGDTTRYKYQWLVSDISLTLDSTKNLTAKVSLNPGSYTLYYIVTDTVTGLSWQTHFALKIVTTYYEGWMVLSDAGTAPRLDMVSYDDAGVGTVVNDILGKVGSTLVLSGEAKNVTCTGGFGEYGIFITTSGNGTTSVDPENFTWKSTNDIKYYMRDNTIAPDFYADPFVPFSDYYLNSENISIYNNGNVYFAKGGPFGLPVNRFQGEPKNFYAAPFIAGETTAYLYDQVNRRFAYNNSIAGYCNSLPAYGTSGATMFDFNNTKMDLVYMAFSWYNVSTVFSILKEPVTGKYHLALIDYSSQMQTYYQEMPATDITSAAHFAINIDYGYVFYAVGGKLYEYDLGLKSSKLMKDYGASQITDITSGIWLVNQRVPLPLQKKLIVSTYDPAGIAGSNGKFEIFTVPPVNGSLVLNESYTGFGKIKGISYRQR